MAAFQDTREQTEQKVMVHLLSEIERNPSFTQRGLAGELGIALGLMNQYLKRCTSQGLVRVSQISPRRISYFLTPKGLKEKSLMVKDYLARSLTFFRDAKIQCEEAAKHCNSLEWCNIALVGTGDLADIARLVFQGAGLNVNVVDVNENLDQYDAILVTDISAPQNTYDILRNRINCQNILVLKLLHISRVVF